MLKGWFDRTLVPGATWDLPSADGKGTSLINGLVPRLANVKRIVAVSTYGAPQYLTVLAGDNGRNCIGTAIRPVFAPGCTCHWLGLYQLDNCSHEARVSFASTVTAAIRDL
jgi:NAD(P)H dehydrogenase (quinone)